EAPTYKQHWTFDLQMSNLGAEAELTGAMLFAPMHGGSKIYTSLTLSVSPLVASRRAIFTEYVPRVYPKLSGSLYLSIH
ncbi:hypothetical protein ACJX0J_013298, partial [Zea mays]